MWYSHYRGRCVGRLLGCIERYCGLTIADNSQYGDGRVTYGSELFATYQWEGDTDVPVFDFLYKRPSWVRQDDHHRLLEYYRFKQDLFKPFLNEKEHRTGCLEFVVQEIGHLLYQKPEAADAEVLTLMVKYCYGWKEEELKPHVSHLREIAKKYRLCPSPTTGPKATGP